MNLRCSPIWRLLCFVEIHYLWGFFTVCGLFKIIGFHNLWTFGTKKNFDDLHAFIVCVDFCNSWAFAIHGLCELWAFANCGMWQIMGFKQIMGLLQIVGCGKSWGFCKSYRLLQIVGCGESWGFCKSYRLLQIVGCGESWAFSESWVFSKLWAVANHGLLQIMGF